MVKTCQTESFRGEPGKGPIVLVHETNGTLIRFLLTPDGKPMTVDGTGAAFIYADLQSFKAEMHAERYTKAFIFKTDRQFTDWLFSGATA